jgi:hypothetical protein
LPKDLTGSEIFPTHNRQPHPETYFLMVSVHPVVLAPPRDDRQLTPSLPIATEQGWLSQRNGNVQDRISVGENRGGEGRARVPQVATRH